MSLSRAAGEAYLSSRIELCRDGNKKNAKAWHLDYYLVIALRGKPTKSVSTHMAPHLYTPIPAL